MKFTENEERQLLLQLACQSIGGQSYIVEGTEATNDSLHQRDLCCFETANQYTFERQSYKNQGLVKVAYSLHPCTTQAS